VTISDVSLLEQLRSALANRYTVERELGRGGMASVFLAEDLKHKRLVAIKVLTPDIGRLVGSDRFLREIEIAARLTHPHILPVFDSGDAGGLLYYVMPFVRGESLRHRLEHGGPLPVAEAVRIAREVADALDYAHRHGYVHRDIKPENVLLEEGHAFVADFGVARALAAGGQGPKLTEIGFAIGTPYYMSPEQAAGDAAVDGRADLYALGCVLYEMLAGRPVFEGTTAQALARQHLVDTPRRLRTLRQDVPAAVEQVVARALAKTPGDRWTSGAEIAAALESGDVPAFRGGRRLRQRWIVGGAVVGLAAAAVLVTGLRRRPALDRDLVAVAPFDVLAPELQLWREGLVDIVARNLDGAGSLRVVAPTIAVRRWEGRADAPAARQLGRRTRAGLAVFGTVVSTGGDSVRLTATLYDVVAQRPITDLVVRDVADRMDRVADSLSLALLRELARTRQIGTVRLASVGSGSLPALRAFLRAEQWYRRTDWDSAIAYYERAIAADSTFALPWWRIGNALGWQRSGLDAVSRQYHLRAGALNHGLAPRDSLLVAADSLTAVLYTVPAVPGVWARAGRLFAVLDEAARRYPDDPEVWYAVGDGGYHFGQLSRAPIPDREILGAFDRAIALDSAFGPAYIHPVQLALALEGAAAGMRYADAYLALQPKDVNAAGIRLVRDLLTGGSAATAALDRATPAELFHAATSAAGAADTGEIGVQIARALHARGAPADSLTNRYRLAFALAARGRLREALPLAQGHPWQAEVVAQGALPADSADRRFAGWLATDTLSDALWRWWAPRRDTLQVQAVLARLEALARGAPPRRPDLAAVPRAVLLPQLDAAIASTRIALAFARGDTAAAVAAILAQPDTARPGAPSVQLFQAQVLAASGRLEEAAARLDRQRVCCMAIWAAPWALERARVNERLGRRDVAIDAYRYVIEVWAQADAALQPYVAEARAALRRLAAEEGGAPR
jgi:serine/threonine-protein kinase